MKNILSAILMAVALYAPAHALEPSSTIKVSTMLKTKNSWDGKPLAYPAGTPEITGMVVEIPPGGETGWHLHPVPSFGLVLEGELDVLLKDGKTKHLKAGDAVAEVVGTLHNGRNVGKVPVKLVVFYAGAAGQSLTAMEGAHQPKAP